MKERRGLAQTLSTGLGLSRGTPVGPDTGWTCGWGPGRGARLGRGWECVQELDTDVHPDTNWDWDLIHGRSERWSPDCSWGCWTGNGTGSKHPVQH